MRTLDKSWALPSPWTRSSGVWRCAVELKVTMLTWSRGLSSSSIRTTDSRTRAIFAPDMDPLTSSTRTTSSAR